MRAWLGQLGVKTAFIEKANPWENGYKEPLNGRLRDELLNGKIFYTLKEAKILIKCRWRHYKEVRPRSAPGYRPPVPAAIMLASAALGPALLVLRPPRPGSEQAVRRT